MRAVWVLGSGGLLGGAIRQQLLQGGDRVFQPPQRFEWQDGERLRQQLTQAIGLFAEQAAAAPAWEIYWAAGIGTMGSRPEALGAETQALTEFSRMLQAEPRLRGRGAIAYTSSAGAIYAGCTDQVITERSAPAPTTPYAHEKLRQEMLLQQLGQSMEDAVVLVARISTVYGAGQSAGKRQGLLAHIARSILRNRAIQIYVPYDTIRDYIAADDAARLMVTALRDLREQGRTAVKIIASEQPTTIAEVISVFKRISRKKPLIVTSADPLTALYSRRMQFRSVEPMGVERPPMRSILVGAAELMASEAAAHAAGRSY